MHTYDLIGVPVVQSAHTSTFPCDRGMSGGPRDYHHYQSLPGGVPTCRYCGAVAAKGWA